MADTAAAEDAPRLHRVREGRLLGGVGGGIARHLGIDPVVARLALLALSLGGVGIAVYVGLLFFVPVDDADGSGPGPLPGTARRAAGAEAGPDGSAAHSAGAAADGPDGDRRNGRDLTQILAYTALACGFGVLFLIFGGLFDPLLWFLVFGAIGAAILWQQANPAQRDEWVSATAVRGRKAWLRAGAGVLLIIIGVVGFLGFQQQLHEARGGLTFALAMLAGIGLIGAPWIVGLVRERDRERRERIRNQERAELAAHIHDSVLHTLTLIQRRAEDPREVQRLARVQERALRSWLYQRPADAETTVKAALERVAAEVEEAHGVPIDVVCVGDGPMDDGVHAELRAAREAMVNASKYAGPATISVFGEVEPEQVLVFVRDRGEGFDLEAVPEDRMGVRGSIIGRMERHGGTVRIRTAPGEGTEVQLAMPRAPQPES